MNSEQYHALLQDLAKRANMADPSGLVDHGRVRIGDLDAVLEHAPGYDPKLLQVRLRLGALPQKGDELVRAVLEANYTSGYGGECVFSLYPATDDVIITMRVRLDEAMTAQELWQAISDVARHATHIWEGIAAETHTAASALPHELRMMPGMMA
ncbi:CesT family type III secretion system chaperone [Caenimonas sp. SL110]|uniref:CesT family type III secretion system chaperone n=1 Tax=Caenimonas sp. SL110 TaxID=1450524 RepID=UPI000653C5E1|nr:CesT family type III secretion system chaperone [Caenimonas sp. SL110]